MYSKKIIIRRYTVHFWVSSSSGSRKSVKFIGSGGGGAGGYISLSARIGVTVGETCGSISSISSSAAASSP